MNYIWDKNHKKAMQALKSLPEGEMFIVICGNSAIVVAHHEGIVAAVKKLLSYVKNAMEQIAAQRPHYSPVVDALTVANDKIDVCMQSIAAADKINKLHETSGDIGADAKA